MLETQSRLQSGSRVIEVCHGPREVTSGKPEVSCKTGSNPKNSDNG